MKLFKRITALVVVLAMTVVFAACGSGTSEGSSANSDSAAASSRVSGEGSSEAESDAGESSSADSEIVAESSSAVGDAANESAAASSEEPAELAGKPWVTSIIQGNLPEEQPSVKDDMFTHYNYDYLVDHQEVPGTISQDYASELQISNIELIKDSSKTNHDLEQLRIFFAQASDSEALAKTGLDEVQPYLDRIDAVSSISEMNELLTADDFQFSPMILAGLSLADTREVNIVSVNPNLVFVDAMLIGGVYYQDSDDPQEAENLRRSLMMSANDALMDLAAEGMDNDELLEVFETMADFEKTYGKFVDYSGKYAHQDFGAAAEAVRKSYITLDELCARCPNFPMQATLEKLGKGGSPLYVVSAGWAEALNEVWTDENIEVIKQIVRLKVLNETRPYRDPTVLNQLCEASGVPADDAETFAYKACDSLDTFSYLLAKNYIEETLGANAKERLTKLTEEIVNTYKELVANTGWMGDESRERIIEKLDHMTLNILEPVGGFYDFSGIELTPAEEGGTLLGNYLKLKQYRLDQESKLVGQHAIAASPWFMVKPSIPNAFYDSISNSINLLPGYVTSFCYTEEMDDTQLLAGIGSVIGHEISHGFDYAGAQFDAYGTPNPVFADADVDAFVLKTTTVAQYFNDIEVAPGTMVNGEQVVTEAAADLCSVHAIIEIASKMDSIDYDKLFLYYSRIWAQVVPETSLAPLLLDVHPLNNLRVNVNMQMFDPIYDELGVEEGDGMYLAPEERINIWGPNA